MKVPFTELSKADIEAAITAVPKVRRRSVGWPTVREVAHHRPRAVPFAGKPRDGSYKWMHRDGVNRRVLLAEVKELTADGWTLGQYRKLRHLC